MARALKAIVANKMLLSLTSHGLEKSKDSLRIKTGPDHALILIKDLSMGRRSSNPLIRDKANSSHILENRVLLIIGLFMEIKILEISNLIMLQA